MPKLVVFNQISLDGFFTGVDGDLSWAYQNSDDAEFEEFVANNARHGETLLLGRVTYEMMASYWPTPEARQSNPVVAERMNVLRKIVFSRTLDQPSWDNTTLLRGDLIAQVERIRQEPGEHITILGSGTITAQLAEAGLIDEYHLLVSPVVLGQGRTMFDGMQRKLELALIGTRAFANGKVLLRYRAAAE